MLSAHTLINRIRLALHVHKAPINRKRVNCNVQNVQALPVVLALQLAKVHVRQPIVKNVAHPANIWILKVVCVAHAVMDSINRTKVHSHAYCADSVKRRVQLRQHHVKNVATNALRDNNWVAIHDVNHAQEAHTVLKAFNQHAPHVHSVVQHQKWALHRSKSVRCQCANRAHI